MKLLKLCFMFIYLMSNIDLSGFYIFNNQIGQPARIRIGEKEYQLKLNHLIPFQTLELMHFR